MQLRLVSARRMSPSRRSISLGVPVEVAVAPRCTAIPDCSKPCDGVHVPPTILASTSTRVTPPPAVNNECFTGRPQPGAKILCRGRSRKTLLTLRSKRYPAAMASARPRALCRDERSGGQSHAPVFIDLVALAGGVGELTPPSMFSCAAVSGCILLSMPDRFWLRPFPLCRSL